MTRITAKVEFIIGRLAMSPFHGVSVLTIWVKPLLNHEFVPSIPVHA